MNYYCLAGLLLCFSKRVFALFAVYCLALCIVMACVSVFQCLDLYAAFYCIAVTPLCIPELESQ